MGRAGALTLSILGYHLCRAFLEGTQSCSRVCEGVSSPTRGAPQGRAGSMFFAPPGPSAAPGTELRTCYLDWETRGTGPSPWLFRLSRRGRHEASLNPGGDAGCQPLSAAARAGGSNCRGSGLPGLGIQTSQAAAVRTTQLLREVKGTLWTVLGTSWEGRRNDALPQEGPAFSHPRGSSAGLLSTSSSRSGQPPTSLEESDHPLPTPCPAIPAQVCLETSSD